MILADSCFAHGLHRLRLLSYLSVWLHHAVLDSQSVCGLNMMSMESNHEGTARRKKLRTRSFHFHTFFFWLRPTRPELEFVIVCTSSRSSRSDQVGNFRTASCARADRTQGKYSRQRKMTDNCNTTVLAVSHLCLALVLDLSQCCSPAATPFMAIVLCFKYS